MLTNLGRFARLPGADLVLRGAADARAGRDTAAAALVQMARAKLNAAGIYFPEPGFAEPAGHRLYDILTERSGRARGFEEYNAMLGRLTSFLDAADHIVTGSRRRGAGAQP